MNFYQSDPDFWNMPIYYLVISAYKYKIQRNLSKILQIQDDHANAE